MFALGAVVTFLPGCGTKIPWGSPRTRIVREVIAANTVQSEKFLRTVIRASGYTGIVRVRAERRISRIETSQEFSEEYQQSLTVGRSLWARSETLLQRKEIGIPEERQCEDRIESVSDEPLTIEVPEAGIRASRKTNTKGELDFHLLEAVVATNGGSGLTVKFSMENGTTLVQKYSKAEVGAMLQRYRRAVENQHQSSHPSGKSVLSTLRKAKVGHDVYTCTKLIYDNYRLLKSGFSISRAFRLTLPSFILGLIVEEIVWHAVETHYGHESTTWTSRTEPLSFRRYLRTRPPGTAPVRFAPRARRRFSSPNAGRRRFSSPGRGKRVFNR